jgi:ribonuclease/clavin/mitogillin
VSELPEGISPATEPVPRNSASGIVLRLRDDGDLEVLLGLRSRRSRFMPGHYAFPGGGMEPGDRSDEPGAWERCASREMREETGLEVPVDAWHDGGERVTPPMFPVRFRTRFLVAELPRGHGGESPAPNSAENERLEFRAPRSVLEAWTAGQVKIPPPVLPILRAIDAGSDHSVAAVASDVRRATAQEEAAPRIEFAPDVWMLPVRTQTLPPATHTNVWMPGGRRFVIVDPGTRDAAELARLMAVVQRRQDLGQIVEAVLLTHRHRDHSAGALAVAEQLGCGVRAHASVLEALDSTPTSVERKPLDDGDEIDLHGMTLRAFHTPGHAPGHLAFVLVEPNLLVAGDLVGGMSTILIDPVLGDMDLYLASLDRARKLGCRMLLPGHGPPIPGGQLGRLIEHRLGRESMILDQLSSRPIRLSEIARTVYAAVPEMPTLLTEGQTLSHLIRLERHGEAQRLGRSGATWRLSPSASGSEPGPRETATRIEEILRRRFDPVHLALADDSANHAGHAGATSGGGHFQLELVSASFEGKTRVEQHRLVYEALSELIPGAIHALGLVTRAPSESEGR